MSQLPETPPAAAGSRRLLGTPPPVPSHASRRSTPRNSRTALGATAAGNASSGSSLRSRSRRSTGGSGRSLTVAEDGLDAAQTSWIKDRANRKWSHEQVQVRDIAPGSEFDLRVQERLKRKGLFDDSDDDAVDTSSSGGGSGRNSGSIVRGGGYADDDDVLGSGGAASGGGADGGDEESGPPQIKRRRSFAVEHDETFDSVDVDDFASAVHQLRQISDLSARKTRGNKAVAKRWLFLLGVAVGTGVTAVFITWAARLLLYAKFVHVVNPLIESELAGSLNLGVACVVYIGFNLALVVLACFTVIFGARIAAGSGIPEVRCWLNGVKIKFAVRFKTLVMKVIGVTLASASGLPVGKEGPMIHSGAVVGAGISQGKTALGKWSKVDKFRNDKAKLDFIACGAAAGVSAAFGAPIGGVLFCLEEGASWWHPNLTTQSFFCTIVACFLTIVVLSGVDEDGLWDWDGFARNLSAPGTFSTAQSLQFFYHWWDLPIFMIVGLVGGLCGAVFNIANHKILLWRKRHITPNRCRSLLETMVISVLVSLVAFGLPLFFGECVPMPDEEDRIEGTSFVTFYCADYDERGKYYNQLATLTFTGFESAIKQLFYFNYDKEFASTVYYTAFSDTTLAVAFVFFLFLTCITFGLAVPAGVFVPSLMCGALMGRFIGQVYDGLLQGFYDPGYNASGQVSNYTVNPGAYSVVGAASMLGGVTHMVISLTVIVVECTDGLNLALPIMFALFVAKWTSSRFGHGLYDRYIHEKHVGFLEWAAPKYFHQLLTQDVMIKQPVCLRQVEKVRRIYDILCDTKCHGFPVILAPRGAAGNPETAPLGVRDVVPGSLAGIILRNHLLVLLSKRGIETVRYAESDRPAQAESRGAKLYEKFLTEKEKIVGYAAFEGTYPRYPAIHDIQLDEEQLESWIDLSPYMGIPYTAPSHAPLMRTFNVFRHLGLRHLVATDNSSDAVCEAVGMITRKQLDHDYTETVFETIYGEGAHSHEPGCSRFCCCCCRGAAQFCRRANNSSRADRGRRDSYGSQLSLSATASAASLRSAAPDDFSGGGAKAATSGVVDIPAAASSRDAASSASSAAAAALLLAGNSVGASGMELRSPVVVGTSDGGNDGSTRRANPLLGADLSGPLLEKQEEEEDTAGREEEGDPAEEQVR